MLIQSLSYTCLITEKEMHILSHHICVTELQIPYYWYF